MAILDSDTPDDPRLALVRQTRDTLDQLRDMRLFPDALTQGVALLGALLDQTDPAAVATLLATHRRQADSALMLRALLKPSSDHPTWRRRLLNEGTPDGEHNLGMVLTWFGRLDLLKIASRQGLNLAWKDHLGNNLAGHLFKPHTSGYAHVDAAAWLRRQRDALAWLGQRHPEVLTQAANLANRSGLDRLGDHLTLLEHSTPSKLRELPTADRLRLLAECKAVYLRERCALEQRGTPFNGPGAPQTTRPRF